MEAHIRAILYALTDRQWKRMANPAIDGWYTRLRDTQIRFVNPDSLHLTYATGKQETLVLSSVDAAYVRRLLPADNSPTDLHQLADPDAAAYHKLRQSVYDDL